MKTLITGGGGFAGSHLAEYLIEQGVEVTALVHDRENLANLEHILHLVRVERADVRNAERLLEVLRETRPQNIYHLAAMSSPVDSFRDPKLTYEVNFVGALNLFWACQQLQLNCRLLYVSSSEVYGALQSEELPFREDLPLRPASPYATSKAAAELLAVQFFQNYGLPIVRARPFNHTGPRQSAAYVCSDLARQIAEIDLGLRRPNIRVGNLKICRDFSDVRDIVRGYHLLMEKGEPGCVYQLCSGTPVSIETILRSLIALASKPVQITVDEARLRSQEPPVVWGDPSRARQAVGWKAQYELQTTLRDLRLYWENAILRAVNSKQVTSDQQGGEGTDYGERKRRRLLKNSGE